MKHTIRLNEGQLRKMIAESVKKVLREYDEPFPYDYKDAREREDYYQRAVQHDFPDEGRFKTGRSWEDMYYDLADKKNQADREKQKLDKQKARDEKKRAMTQKKAGTAERKNKINYMWAKAVKEALTGTDNPEDNYDGIMDLPVVFKDGSEALFHAHSFMKIGDYIDNETANALHNPKNLSPNTNSYNGYSEAPAREYDKFSFRLGGTIDGVDETDSQPEMYLTVFTYVSPMDVEVVPVVKNIDNVSRLATKKAVTQVTKKEAIKRYRQLMKMQ